MNPTTTRIQQNCFNRKTK